MKRTPLKRSKMNGHTAPMKKRRSTPRRGRVVDKLFLRWCSLQPCCITNELPATTHHVRSFGSQKDDTRVVRLVARLHMHEFGMFSIERLGKEKFEEHFGIVLEDEILKLRTKYEREAL